MLDDSLSRIAVCGFSAWVLFYGTGQAVLGTTRSALPESFARVLTSVIVSTLIATTLAAFERFSLVGLLSCNLAFGLSVSVLRRSFAHVSGADTARRDPLGPLIFVVALVAYGPGYPTFLGTSDATAYIATGVSLAHHGTLARDDDVARELPRATREILFDSMSQVFGSSGPPYRRMPGGMLVESLDADRAWPSFFPVPSVWAATFVSAGATSRPDPEQAAPNYAPVFAALALWAFWLVAREMFSGGIALVAVVLLGACAPFYMAAHMPLSEGITAFFNLSAIAALTANAARPVRRDVLLAGAAFGAAVFTRVDTALFLALAMAVLPTFDTRRDGAFVFSRPMLAWFFASFVAVASWTLVPMLLVPGTWTLPLSDHVHNTWIRLLLLYGRPSGLLVAAVVLAAAGVAAASARWFGWSATLRWGFVLALLAGQTTAARFLAERTPMWLSFSIGWTGLALAAIGAFVAWRTRRDAPAVAIVLALAAAVAAILFYNPHVYPSLPWGARRFVPMLLPLLVLLACTAASFAYARNRLLGVACLALIAVPVFLGGKPLWGRDVVEGAYERLAQLNDAIPLGGSILVDRQVSPMMVGISLWLVHDRNGVNVPPTDSAASRIYLPGLVWYLAGKGPVYFVTRALGSQTRTPNVRMKLLARIPVSLLLLEQTYDRRPRTMQNYVMPLAVYQLDRSIDKKGGPTR